MNCAVFFRGINVGGKNVVKMNDLKPFLQELGLKSVQTYIQSGNAVLSSELDEATLQYKIENGFAERFGFTSSVIIRDSKALHELIMKLPFSPEEMSAAEAADPRVAHLYVYFLDRPPEQEQMNRLCTDVDGSDRMSVGARDVYLLCQQSIRLSKLAARTSKLFAEATVRNWRTICKIDGMLTKL